MTIKILGSGGCVSTPRPCCNCKVCREAREKGVPYARTGCSLLIEDTNILIDTPEDINQALNQAEVKAVDCILYSHIDPDHTMGMRVVEQLRKDWLNSSVGLEEQNPILVATLPQILSDLKCQSTKYGSVMDYYESENLIRTKGLNTIKYGAIEIQLIPANDQNTVAIFIITDGMRKIIYAPCDVKPFPENSIFHDADTLINDADTLINDADTLIIGNTIVGDVLKDGFILNQDNPLRNELFMMDEIVDIKNKHRIKNVVITHLEEDWGKTYDDYLELEKHYQNIRFAYDGMEI